MESSITKVCILCCSEIRPKRGRYKEESDNGQSRLENLCDFLGVSYSSFNNLFSNSISSSTICFCMYCDAEIMTAVELKKKLEIITKRLKRISTASKYPIDDTICAPSQVYALHMWKFVQQSLSECRVVVRREVANAVSNSTANLSLMRADFERRKNPETSAPSSPVAFRASKMEQVIEIDLSREGSCDSDKVTARKKMRMTTVELENIAFSSDTNRVNPKVANVEDGGYIDESDWDPENGDDDMEENGVVVNEDADRNEVQEVNAQVSDDVSIADGGDSDSDWEPGDEVSDGGDNSGEEGDEKDEEEGEEGGDRDEKEEEEEAGEKDQAIIEMNKKIDEKVAKAVKITASSKKPSGLVSELSLEKQGPLKVIGEECDSCRIMCVTTPLLDLHKQEVHSSEDSSLDLNYQCEFCGTLMEATDFLCAEQNAPGCKRYSVTKENRTEHFSNFYEVCENHYLQCWRQNQVATVKNQFGIIDFYEGYQSFESCHICDQVIPVPVLPHHYKQTHRISLWYGVRFSCGYCNEPYMATTSNTPIGRFLPSEDEHFKAFAALHNNCRNVCQVQPDKNYKCSDCDAVFSKIKFLFAHSMSQHTNERNSKCEACSRCFLSYSDLRDHVGKFHSAATRTHCGRCTASFLSRADYIDHIKLHAGRQAEISVVPDRYQCSQCPRIMTGTRGLRRHILKCHLNSAAKVITPQLRLKLPVPTPWNNFQCFLCREKCNSIQFLSLHLREFHDKEEILSFRCSLCRKEFIKSDCASAEGEDGPTTYGENSSKRFSTFPEFVKDHLITCGADTQMQQQKRQLVYKCSKCKEIFQSGSTLASHFRIHYMDHINEWPVRCNLCSSGANDKQELEKHVLRAHNLKNTCMDQYYCRYCLACYIPLNPELETGRFSLAELDNFKVFAAVHEKCSNPLNLKRPDVIINCKFCSQAFKHPKLVFKHEISAHTKNYPLFCEICGTGTTTQEELTCHKRHHREKTFKCNLCQRAFRTKYKLNSHMNVHNDYRPFICEICGKTFHSNNNLKYHEGVHLEKEKHECPKCMTVFRTKDKLDAHINVHNNYRPFICEICGKSFHSDSNLKFHAAVHLPKETYECPKCMKVIRKDYVTRHKCMVDKDGNPLPKPKQKRRKKVKVEPGAAPRKKGRPRKSEVVSDTDS